MRPFAAPDYRELRALDGVSFEIHQGEFFGIVGRNGSGKSTLLKLLASIYRADSGTIRMAGRLAPFIELGVGFNDELTARENVVLNGVMMGLTPKEMRRRVDAVIEFAELEEFADLKLKNFSSGMLVRLAFSVMLEADADVLLIDEVLAVGDASFQQKCADVFHEMKVEGKTIVLVTHEMGTVETYCHRAMLIGGGKIQHLGDPDEVGRRYLRMNFEESGNAAIVRDVERSAEVRLLDAWIEGEDGSHVGNVEYGHELNLQVELEALDDVAGFDLGFIIANADAVAVSQLALPIARADGSTALAAGERIKVGTRIENLLVDGRYSIHCGISHVQKGNAALYVHDAVEFVVFGGASLSHGVVQLPHQVEIEIERGGEA